MKGFMWYITLFLFGFSVGGVLFNDNKLFWFVLAVTNGISLYLRYKASTYANH